MSNEILLDGISTPTPYSAGQHTCMTLPKSHTPYCPHPHGTRNADLWWQGFNDEKADAEDAVLAILNG